MNATQHDQVLVTSVHEQLTMARLLEERLLRGARVTGDCESLDRVVVWCLPWDQAIAATDALTGILVYARAAQVDPAGIRSLERRGAAGLVLSDEIEVESAGLSAFAVVHAHTSVDFHQLSRLIAELTLAREAHVLRYGLSVHRGLADLLYRGAGLAALCREMALLSRCAVAILDQEHRVLAFEQSQGRSLDPAAVAEALREGTADLVAQAGVHPSPTVRLVSLGGTAVTCIVTPIVLSGRHEGWVIILESAEPPHPHDVAEHRVVVEQAATIVGTEMLRMRSVEEAEERARGDFVHALLHGRFSNVHDLEIRAAHYKFPTDATYGVIVAGGIGTSGATESLNALFQLARDVTRLAPRPHVHTLATVVGDVLAVIRQIDPSALTGSPEAMNQPLAEYAGILEQELRRRIHRPIPVAYGRPVRAANRIFDSYRDARIALGLRDRLHIEGVCGFQDLRVFAVLAEVAAGQQGRAFASDLLAPLRGLRAEAGDLEHSVIAYIACGGNLNAASRELHVHRNTMLYKLDRASQLLQLDLRQAENQFAVWLAYKLRTLAETTAAVDRDLTPT